MGGGGGGGGVNGETAIMGRSFSFSKDLSSLVSTGGSSSSSSSLSCFDSIPWFPNYWCSDVIISCADEVT